MTRRATDQQKPRGKASAPVAAPTASRRSASSKRKGKPLAASVRWRVLVTGGPTHEPIDAVRFIGNRSSGRVATAIADAAAKAGHRVQMLLGPSAVSPLHSRVRVQRFQTTADLQGMLAERFESADLLIMAAAVADFRPIVDSASVRESGGKLRRSAAGLTLRLEPTPDLLAELKPRKRPGQYVIGFALEPAARLESSAKDKLARKGLDAIVANELETMDSPTIRATVFFADGKRVDTPGELAKAQFGTWLMSLLAKQFSTGGTVR